MASGGILILFNSPTVSSGVSAFAGANNTGFCSHDADVVASPVYNWGVGTVTYKRGRIMEARSSNSANIAQGKGFLASAIEGVVTLSDGDGKIAADVTSGALVLDVLSLWIADLDSAGTMTPLFQGVVVDHLFAEGKLQLTVKSPAYIQKKPIYGIRTATQLDTDPVDPSNPSNPTYLWSSAISQFAGMAFGSHAVSLKAGNPLPVETLARYGHTALQSGDISVLTDSVAYVTKITGQDIKDGHITEPAFMSQTLNADGSVKYGAVLKMFCRCDSMNPAAVDSVEVMRFASEILAFISAGYSIILSDGNWYLDITNGSTLWNGTLNSSVSTSINTSGAAWGTFLKAGASAGLPNYSFVWFNLNNTDGTPQIPTDPIDGTAVKIFAVPPSIAVSAGQYVLDGFARNGKTVAINGTSSFDGAIEIFKPGMANADGFVGITPVVAPLAFNAGTSGPHLGAFEDQSSHVTGTSGTVVGSTSAVIVDPAVGWNGGTDPITATLTKVQGVGGLTPGAFILRLQLKTTLETYDADFFCADTSFVATITQYLGAFAHPIAILIQGAFEQACNYKAALNSGPAYSLAMSNKAQRNRTLPKWGAKSGSLDELNSILSPALVWNNPNDVLMNCSFILREIFIWAFTKFGFSQIYSTVYPFWTRGRCSRIATDGATKVLAGGVGLGTSTGAGMTWAPISLPQTEAGGILVYGSAYGSFTWVTVGTVTPSGGSALPRFWYSADGLSWTEGSFSGTARPRRVRFLGTHFVAMFSDGSIQTSTDGITWASAVATGASNLYDMTYDGTNYIAVGPAGHIYKSTNLTAWTGVTASAITDEVYGIAWIPSGAGGEIYTAVGYNGKAYYANRTQALSGAWTAVLLGAAGSYLDSIATDSSGSIAVVSGTVIGVGFRAWSTSDGASFSPVFTDGSDAESASIGYGSAVGYIPGKWIIGTDAPNIITSTQGSNPVDWTPWATNNPEMALKNIQERFFGGILWRHTEGAFFFDLPRWNQILWTGAKYYVNLQSWGIAFDPPANSDSGTTADAAMRKICEEWWAFAGEMAATTKDGSADAIEIALPEVAIGNIEDVATLITVEYQPFGGAYLSKAYIQNVDVDRATAGKPDSFFFAGWDDSGNANGLAIWTACRSAYLATGVLRSVSLAFDSVHNAGTLGTLWTTADTDLGSRIRWLCSRPQYLKVKVMGNQSAAATTFSGTRYKPNLTMLSARGMTLPGTGQGVCINCDHDYLAGTHAVETAFAPQ